MLNCEQQQEVGQMVWPSENNPGLKTQRNPAKVPLQLTYTSCLILIT